MSTRTQHCPMVKPSAGILDTVLSSSAVVCAPCLVLRARKRMLWTTSAMERDRRRESVYSRERSARGRQRTPRKPDSKSTLEATLNGMCDSAPTFGMSDSSEHGPNPTKHIFQSKRTCPRRPADGAPPSSGMLPPAVPLRL